MAEALKAYQGPITKCPPASGRVAKRTLGLEQFSDFVGSKGTLNHHWPHPKLGKLAQDHAGMGATGSRRAANDHVDETA